MKKKFLRQDTNRFSKLGKKRKKLQKWRKPKGRDSKMRQKMKSYNKVVSIGYKSDKNKTGRISEKLPLLIYNVRGLEKVGKNNVIIIGKVGAKKKIEILKKADEMKLNILNLEKLKNAIK